jgi:hypothetical protein
MQAVKQAAPPRPVRMKLDAIQRGRIAKPMRIVLAGTEGVGKSTFASCAPSPIFLGAEDGTAQLDVARLPEPLSWEDALDAVVLLTDEQHDFKTLAIDTLDWLEPLCWEKACRGAGKKSIEDFSFGKGYIAALDLWRELLAMLDRMRTKRGMHVILIAHTWIKTFKNPEESGDYDRYELKLHAKTGGLIKEWADAVLFARHEVYTKESNGRTKGYSDGTRVIHTERRAAWDAKNRFGLPEHLPLNWEDFAAAVEAGAPATPEVLLATIAELVKGVGDDVKEATTKWLATNGNSSNATKLAQMADRLRAKQIEEKS